MATLTSNISNVSLTVSGNTTQLVPISWTLPSVPSGGTITACTLTGKATASMSKGNATIKVNGTTVSSGSNFTINLDTSNTTSSVTASVVGGNKNANGTVTLSNLVYTVTYTEPAVTYTVTFKDWDGTVLKTEEVGSGSFATAPEVSRYGYILTGWSVDFSNVRSNITTVAQYEIANVLTIKENGSWSNIGRVFKKTSGVWVEQTNQNWNGLFDTNLYYVQKSIPIPTAVLYSDGSFIFSPHSNIDSSHGDVISTYTGWDTTRYSNTGDNAPPWYIDGALTSKIKKIYFNNISALFTSFWFRTGSASTSHSIVEYVNCMGVTNTINSSYMFYYCINLTSINLNNFDTSKVTDMGSMFEYCKNLTSLDLSSFDTSNVVDMGRMFYKCSSLTSLDLSSFDMSKVTLTTSMFGDCANLQTIYVKDETAKTKIESSANFPTTATVIIGKPN